MAVAATLKAMRVLARTNALAAAAS